MGFIYGSAPQTDIGLLIAQMKKNMNDQLLNDSSQCTNDGATRVCNLQSTITHYHLFTQILLFICPTGTTETHESWHQVEILIV